MKSFRPPADELGVCVPINRLLGQSAIAAVGLLRIVVYASGLDFRFAAAWNDPDLVTDSNEFGIRLRRPDDHSLKLGLRLKDGTAITNVDGPKPFHLGPPTGLRQDLTWWIPSIAPDGDMEVFCQWPLAGLDMSSIVIPGDPIQEAAAQPPERWTRPV